MSLLIDPLSSNFLPSFLAGVAVNFEIAAMVWVPTAVFGQRTSSLESHATC